MTNRIPALIVLPAEVDCADPNTTCTLDHWVFVTSMRTRADLLLSGLDGVQVVVVPQEIVALNAECHKIDHGATESCEPLRPNVCNHRAAGDWTGFKWEAGFPPLTCIGWFAASVWLRVFAEHAIVISVRSILA